MTIHDSLDSLDEVEAVLGPIPRGPVIGGEVLTGLSTFDVVDPGTERSLATLSVSSRDDALRAVDVARESMEDWSAASPRRRSDVLRRAYELMTQRADSLARLVVLENGKALPDARSEITYAAEFLRWYSEEAVRLEGSLSRAPEGENNIVVRRRPIGVSYLITPWNFPAAMATRKLGPALAAGCSVILKPASETPLTALAIVEILREAGAPDGVVNLILTEQPHDISAALLDHPDVRKVSFTGSTAVGRVLLGHAARTVVSSAMELGGNAPFLVLADADLDEAVAGAMVAKLRNGGSACTAANRFLVHASIADEFTQRFAAAMRALHVGHGLTEGTQIGPLVNGKTRDKVADLVSGALDQGGSVVVGGGSPAGAGYFYLPTVLGSVPPDAAILDEEIFGPVAPVVSFEDLDEAVASANGTESGLAAYVYSRDLRAGLQVSERLDCGMVGLNRPAVSDPAAPFGGTKQSGLGREGGHDGLLEFTESKYIAVDW